jgi:mono/diheme cytochrome c family protein
MRREARAVLWGSLTLAPLAAADFVREIQPIFESRCHSCHGPKLQMRGFRIDSRAAAFRGGDSGVPSILPGNSAQSPLYRYVAGLDSKIVMPPAGERLKPFEIELLRGWIDGGAEWPESAAQPATDPILARGAGHWSFQPVRKPAVPRVRNLAWVRNPIDAFVLAGLEARGWKPAGSASPQALLRRVYLDLTGMPPGISAQDDFAKDSSAQGLDRLIDDLLARPAYGERWGRHWLDLVRYAETNGYERDAIKPNVWRYRDYVIDAFNRDKPFDRFLTEQLAGDEIPGSDAETLTATGYYRLGPWDDEPADPAEDRFDQLDDIVSTTSQAFLGLTLGCARCHNHKFEPLLARDYYSMVAVFNGLERPRNGRTELDLPAGDRAALERLAARDAKIAPLSKQIEDLLLEFKTAYLRSDRGQLPSAVRGAFLLDPAKRTAADRQLIREHDKTLTAELAAAQPADLQSKISGLESQIAALKTATPDLPRAYRMRETGPLPPATHLLIRGKAASPGPEVPPAVPAILSKPDSAPLRAGDAVGSSGRRLAFARWLADPSNPLTARVLVNRVWQFHFGEGLVRTPNDFGVMGEKPTHPELLDYLASWFVENGWSVKKLHRLILASNTYRMSREGNPAYAAADPENRLLWRTPYRRLEVEAILDSMLSVSGQLNPKMGGPFMYPFVPRAALEGSSDPDKIWRPFDERDASRRTVYAHVKRSMIVPILEVLDFCDTTRSSARRLNTNAATQALTLFNGDFVNRQAAHFARRIGAEAGPSREAQLVHAFRLALSRPPTSEERVRLLAFLETGKLEEVSRVLFNLNEFVYPD